MLALRFMRLPHLATVLTAALLLNACTGPRDQLIVLSFNIHHGEGTDGVFDLERIARVIRDSDADLVALQEVDLGTERSGGVDQAAELARRTSMRHVFGEAIPFQGGSYGDAILTKLPLRDEIVWPLPAEPHHEKRVAVGGLVELPSGAIIRFIGTHLDHTQDPADRVAQTEALLAHLASTDPAPPPTLLLGDLNAGPNSEPLRLLLERFTSAAPGGIPSSPSHAPVNAIDWILYAPKDHWEVLEVHTLHEPIASDHAPLRAVLRRIQR